MIQMQSLLECADNSGAKTLMCIKVLGGTHRYHAFLGQKIVVSVKETVKKSDAKKLKKGDVFKAIIVRTRYPVQRKDGTSIRFDQNAVVLVNDQDEVLGTRVFGPVPNELRSVGMSKILSLAPEVL